MTKTDSRDEWTKEERAELCAGLASLMALFDTTRAAWVEAFGAPGGHSEWFTAQLSARFGRKEEAKA
jgi:hypothetical protein